MLNPKAAHLPTLGRSGNYLIIDNLFLSTVETGIAVTSLTLEDIVKLAKQRTYRTFTSLELKTWRIPRR